jgi:hypothetical protein
MTARDGPHISVTPMGIGVHVEMLRRAACACRPLVVIGIPAASPRSVTGSGYR